MIGTMTYKDIHSFVKRNGHRTDSYPINTYQLSYIIMKYLKHVIPVML